jgi:hypothetical protein
MAPAVLALALATTAACGSTPARNPVPRGLADQAFVPELADVRSWSDETLEDAERLDQRLERMREALRALQRSQGGAGKVRIRSLVLSGGAADGAFGAGLLCGWSQAQTRPQFEIVTGVSTGALTAPFAFLGQAYDGELERFYTSITADDVLRERGLIAMLGSSSAGDASPLRALLEELIDAPLLAEVAREHARGRRLFVFTTNLDAQRPVMWNMGRIAQAGTPQALRLFQDVLMASAAVPGVFPPVLIGVRADGRDWDEMHVDGGVTNQVAFLPEAFEVTRLAEELGYRLEMEAYVIRNARTTPEYEAVEPDLLSIAGRTALTLTKTQGVGDLYRIFLGCLRDGIAFHLAMIPPDFEAPREEEFDQEYMRALFQHARAMAYGGFPWEDAPPRFDIEQFRSLLAPAP